MATPPSDPSAADASSDTSLPANDAAPSSARVVASAFDHEPPSSGALPGGVETALGAFLASREKKKGRSFIRGVIIQRLGKDIEPALLDDLIQEAWQAARKARSAPWTKRGIPSWVSRVTKRAIARYFRSGERDKKYLDRGVQASETSERHAPQTDWGARELLICNWLEKQIGDDPVRRETFRLMMEAHVVGRSLAELAAENHTTVDALSSRFYKLRKELAPRVALMDRENPRLFILGALVLFGVGVGILLIVVLYRLLAPATPTPRQRERPVPSASAEPAPSFDQALPTRLTPLPDLDGGEDKRPRRGP